MKTLFALSCIVALSVASVCPIWKCEPKDSEEYKGHCVFRDGDIIRAGPFCGEYNRGCKLMDWYENGHENNLVCPTSLEDEDEDEDEDKDEDEDEEEDEVNNEGEGATNSENNSEEAPSEETTNSETPSEEETNSETPNEEETNSETPSEDETSSETPSEEETNSETPSEESTTEGEARRRLGLEYQYISETFLQKYCHADGERKNWTVEASCDAFCAPKNHSRFLLFNNEIECNYENFVESRQSSDTSFNEGKEDGWSNCTSDSDCMSNQCECVPSEDGFGRCKSTYEDKTYELFFNFACEEEDHSDYWDNACAYWINVELGHFFEALVANSPHIRCLVDYGDYSDFYKVQGELTEDTWWIYLMVAAALVALVLSIYCCVKVFKGKDERIKYGQFDR